MNTNALSIYAEKIIKVIEPIQYRIKNTPFLKITAY